MMETWETHCVLWSNTEHEPVTFCEAELLLRVLGAQLGDVRGRVRGPKASVSDAC